MSCAGNWDLTKKTGQWSNTPCKCLAKSAHLQGGVMTPGRYCGKHELVGKRHDEWSSNLRYCSGFPKRCGKILEDSYKKKQCESCGSKEKATSKARLAQRTELHDAQLAEKKEHLICVKCGKDHPVECYIASVKNNQDTHYCNKCREVRQKAEENRPQRERDYSEYEKKPEVKERRKKWTEAHPAETRMYQRTYRIKKKIEDSTYLERNAAAAAERRKREQEQGIISNKPPSAQQRWTTATTTAEKKGIPWTLSKEQFDVMCYSECFYCGSEPLNGRLNGIDRLNSEDGYTEANSRASCKACNIGKGPSSVVHFISQSARIILNNRDQILSDLDWDVVETMAAECEYTSANGISYTACKSSANSRGIDFTLTLEDFTKLVRDRDCYLCGNRPPIQCGIDRIDSAIGYTVDNCQPCCAACNYMKSVDPLDKFLKRCLKIVLNCLEDFEELARIPSVHRSRLEARVFQAPIVRLSGLEKREIRHRLEYEFPNYAWIESVVELNTATDEERLEMERFLQILKRQQNELLQRKEEEFEAERRAEEPQGPSGTKKRKVATFSNNKEANRKYQATFQAKFSSEERRRRECEKKRKQRAKKTTGTQK